VRKTHAGWLVEAPGHTCGPFSREKAFNLAEGMVDAVRLTGERAELIIEA